MSATSQDTADHTLDATSKGVVDDSMLAWDTPRAAKALSLSETWLEQMRLKGNGPRYVKIGRRVLYRPADIADWLEHHLRGSTSE